MTRISTMSIIGFFTIVGFAVLPACAGMMEGEHGEMMKKGEAMMEKGETMGKDSSMAEPKKMMKKEPNGAMMEKEKPTARRTAKLTGARNHQATGTAALTIGKNGRSVLTLADIRVDRVPDGRVYLAKGGDYIRGVELGRLTRFSGTVEFPIPAGIDPTEYDGLVIWCKQFNVEIGHAIFDKEMLKTDVSMAEREKDMTGIDKGM